MPLPVGLQPRLTPGAGLDKSEGQGWRLCIPAGPAKKYRLAQVDNYNSLPRTRFPHHPPLTMSLQGCVSSAYHQGTWGVGLWNDPFAMSLLAGGGNLLLPALPQAAWFFYASPQCYLSIRDDLPASGLMAATFRSQTPRFTAGLKLLPCIVSFPWCAARRKLRRQLRTLVLQDGSTLHIDPCQWHTYTITWEVEKVTFQVDSETVLETGIAPSAPLGMVIWIDNQYAAWHPDGRLNYGFLPNPEPAWMEVRDLQVQHAFSQFPPTSSPHQ